ncbi:MAG TPA: hypothetical protein VFA23_10065, partial [Dongiaceae bacterium]|nr:hypothetical protein [Dongiaceae bacterium]
MAVRDEIAPSRARRARGAAKQEACNAPHVDRPSGEPARRPAPRAACRLVAAANPRWRWTAGQEPQDRRRFGEEGVD